MTTLITSPRTQPVWTAVRESDSTMAAARGLAEYLATLTAPAQAGGPELTLKDVYYDDVELEDLAEFPAATVTQLGEAVYTDGKFTPSVSATARIPLPDGRFLLHGPELQIQLVVAVACAQLEQRRAVGLMLEDALWPVDWTFGARLALPHYFGAHATFTPLGLSWPAPADPRGRVWRVEMRVQATIEVIRLGGARALARPRLGLTVESP